MDRYFFYRDVKSPSDNPDELLEMIRFNHKKRDLVDLETFSQEVHKPDFDAVCLSMGYDNDDENWSVVGDWSLDYFKSEFADKPCLLFATPYGFFVFLKEADCKALNEQYQTPSGLVTIKE